MSRCQHSNGRSHVLRIGGTRPGLERSQMGETGTVAKRQKATFVRPSQEADCPRRIAEPVLWGGSCNAATLSAMNVAWRLAAVFGALGLGALILGSLASGAFAGTAYVSASGFVVPINTASNTAGTPIPVGKDSAGVAITPDGRTAYVASFVGGAITPVDTLTNVAGTPVPFATEKIAITPDGSTAFAVGTESVVPISIPSGLVGTPISAGEETRDVVISPDGETAYAVNGKSHSLTPISTRTDTAGPPIPVGTHPVAAAITPDGTTAYVVDESISGSVIPVDLASGIAGTPIPVGKFPSSIAITPDGATAYVANSGESSVTPIDTLTNKPGTPIGVGSFPESIAITPDGATAYVANFFSGSVTPINTGTDTAGMPIAVGESPDGVAIIPSQSPQPAFSISGTAKVGSPVTFDASASRDPFGAISSFSWSFGDGQSAVGGPVVEHTYSVPGTYQVTLTADNGEGCPTFLFTGHTALCGGPSAVRVSHTVTVVQQPGKTGSVPRIRVHCPKGAGRSGCKFALQAVVAKPRHGSGRRPKPETAIARVKLGAGKAVTVVLAPKPAFAAKLAEAHKVLVAERVVIGGGVSVSYRRLHILR